ncbi:mechanosensitive ion channel domain-containing protein [Pseudoalteromonas sp. L21]|uniref:mechanosensitive ion channel family protein n=1 Tax=unclassified Pseudoalteromonas TaxID=194690 RepID=UPI001F171297|nr:mechanosensitive ion channel domain-containing protein [Pseudoalteromonas sp. L21]MCF7518577.1 mechanosensitive ion channel family protein [Pseudoalteromonas sp. L21]
MSTPEVTVKSLIDKNDKEKTDEEKEVTSAEAGSSLTSQQADEALFFDEFNRITPRNTMYGFLTAARARDFELASHYLDYRNLPQDAAAIGQMKLAENLSLILDRTLWVDIDNLSNKPDGKKNEAVPSYRDLVGEISTSQGKVQILLQRVPNKQGTQTIWKISNATVSKIPLLIKEYGYNRIGEWLYQSLPSFEFLGVMLWQWVYFACSFIFFVLVAIVLTRLVSFVLVHLKFPIQQDIVDFINGPICLLIAVIMSRSLSDESNVTIAFLAVIHGATVLLLAWTWVFLRIVDITKHRLSQRFIRQDKPHAVFLLRPVSNVIKTSIVIIMLFVWFENLGFNATTLLAGLGIGGLAIALAAQKTVENIIAAITLYTSAPVRIGNLCKFDNHLGTIEEIGLRATRIRTLDRSVIYVANAKFVDMQLENISERERISYRPKLMLSAKTEQQNLHAFMASVRALLKEHEHIADEPCRVRFKGFTPWALQIDVLSYVETVDFAFYMEIIEELNMAMLGLLNEHNCELANPEFARVVGS